VANLWWMAALGVLMFYEKVGRRGEEATRVAGVGLLVLAAVVLVGEGALSGVVGG
jgi:predicted metal-binding membrane protein